MKGSERPKGRRLTRRQAAAVERGLMFVCAEIDETEREIRRRLDRLRDHMRAVRRLLDEDDENEQ